MRMWLIDPKLMCNQHLLGEHVEMHMFVGTLRKGRSLRGYIEGGLVEVDRLEERHNLLAREMTARGMTHRSPLPHVEYSGPVGRVDPAVSYADLVNRCSRCCSRK